MNFSRSGFVKSDQFETLMLRVADMLREMKAESISEISINCFPWRNGKRLQAVSGPRIVSVAIDLPSDDPSQTPAGAVIRERPDDLGDFGIAMMMGHDD